MKRLTIHIPERKFSFVMELLSSLDFVKIDKPKVDTFILTEEQRTLTNKEFKKFHDDPEYGLGWDRVKERLNFD